MSKYQEKIDKMAQSANLTEEEKRVFEEFVDNYIGTIDEGYIPNEEYRRQHEEELQPIMRKLKDCGVFPELYSFNPHMKKGLLNLL